jgi:hypothetical protein
MNTLKKLGHGQVYVSAIESVLHGLTHSYRAAPGIANQHVIQSIFEPINDVPLVLVFWAFGGLNLVPRDSVKVFNTETLEIIPAWE